MNQSADYRYSKRDLNRPEVDLPVKKQRVVCRFLKSPNSSVNKPPVTVPNSPVNKLPVTVPNSPVNKPCPQPDDGETSRTEALASMFWSMFTSMNESPVTVPNSPVNKPCPQPDDGETSRREICEKAIAWMPKERTTYRYSSEVVAEDSPFLLEGLWGAKEHWVTEPLSPAQVNREVRSVVEKHGYTPREFRICRGYLFQRRFEKSSEPIPLMLRQFKTYLDQIRETRGYGLTVYCAGCNEEDDTEPVPRSIIRCIFDEYENKRDPWVGQYVKRMEEMVVDQIREKMGKIYRCAGLVNLVKCNYYSRLASFHVHEDGTAPSEPPEIAEAFFLMPPINPMLENIELMEWKIRKGQEVLFSTVEITGGGGGRPVPEFLSVW